METNWSAQTVNSCLESVQPVLFFVSFVPNFNSERQYFSVTVWYISYTCSDSHFYGRVAGLAEDISHYLISQPGASALRLLNRSCSAVRSTLLFTPTNPVSNKKQVTLLYMDWGTQNSGGIPEWRSRSVRLPSTESTIYQMAVWISEEINELKQRRPCWGRGGCIRHDSVHGVVAVWSLR